MIPYLCSWYKTFICLFKQPLYSSIKQRPSFTPYNTSFNKGSVSIFIKETMTSNKEIEPHLHAMNNQPVCPVQPKPATPALSWLRMAGKACLATLAQPATGPMLIACVCLATLAYNKRNQTKTLFWRRETAPKKPVPVLSRSMSMAILYGGKAVLERLLDAQEVRDAADLSRKVEKMKTIITTEPIDFKELHRAATKLEMSGKEDVAIKLLKEALHKAQKNEHPHEAYELEMILVEMLIYKGDLDGALQRNCLKHKEISDARVPLYQAIIYTMKNDERYERKYYEEFQSIRSEFHRPDGIEEGSPLYGIVHKFEEFERVVENLRKEIKHAQS